MTARLISVGDDFALPTVVKVADANLPAASNAATVGAKLDAAAAAATYAAKSVETSKLDASQRGAADGVAPLGTDGKVPDANLADRLQDSALVAKYATLDANGKQPVRKSELVLNIKDYGATGVATQDITTQVQAALADIKAAGGGTLLFKDGEFWWPSPHTAQLTSNTTVMGINATLRKRLSSDSTALFCIKSDGATGYGSGARNVRFIGLKVRGDFATGRTAGLLGANHGSNITVENCVFDECLGRGHIMDMGGCENVTVRNNVFRGASYPLDSDKYNECIQADNSTYDGSSAPETVAGSYDGLPSRNFYVTGNKFLPITVAGVDYPAPTPFGSHFSVADQYHSNLNFIDNVVDTPADDRSSTLRGIVHFRGTKGAKVKGNRFINRGNVACHAVKTYVITDSFTTADAGTQNAVSTTLATPMVCADIEVSGNVFIGFGNTTIATIPIINIAGDQATGTNVAGVKVNNNVFESCYGADYTANVGSNLIELADCVDAEIENNRMDGGRRLIYFQDVDRISIRGNKINKTSSGVAVNGFRSTMIDFTGNKINDYAGGFLISGGLGVNVANNQFRGERSTSFTSINIGGTSQRYVVTGNDILSTVTGSKGVLIQQTSTVGIVRTNIVTGMTTPISVTADSTATVDGNL